MSFHSGEFGEGAGSYHDPFDSSYLEEEYERIMSYSNDIDYYSLLALPRDPPPTDAQIRSAYRTLTLSFHPDKQPAHLREAATKQFDRIRQAYDTLIDPKKRIVYDMLGQEGVRMEWGAGGPIDRAEGNQVGVKAMDEEQFRRWFLRTMKARELQAVDQMVQSKTSLTVKVDAHGLAMRMIDPAAAQKAPLTRLSSIGLGFSFKTPFAPFRLIRCLSNGRDEEDAEDQNGGVVIPSERDVQLEIHAAVGGKLRDRKQVVTFMHPVTQEQQTKELELPRVLTAGNISLGATLRHQIYMPAQRKSTRINKILSPMFDGSLVEAGGTLLPAPGAHATISKRIQPIPNTAQINVAVQAQASDLTFKTPPVLTTSISRRIGARGLTYCNWASGTLLWPSFLQGLFESSTSDENELTVMAENTSKFEIGYAALPVRRVQTPSASSDEADEDEELEQAAVGTSEPMETWGFLLHSSPYSLQLTMNYSRNIFGGGKAEEPPRSEWNYEGYQPQKETRISRAVRLEVTTTVDVINQGLGWMVTGTRQVSDFTHMGLGVGVQGNKGLVCTVTWRRLGQAIKVPIAICPLDHLESDIGVLAVVIPWITYSIVEFGFLRPRERRKQKQALAKERKRLRNLIQKRKVESIQAVNLMRDQVQRRQAREDDKNGLVILQAEYGYLPPNVRRRRDGEADEFSRMVDVTIPLAALVDQGQLTIPSQVIKSQILGFYDPAPFMPKVLRIQYRFAGAVHEVEVPDSEGVAIPMRSHVV